MKTGMLNIKKTAVKNTGKINKNTTASMFKSLIKTD